MKNRRKPIVFFFLMVFVLVLIQVGNNWLLLYPKAYFEHETAYGQFQVYSDHPLHSQHYAMLDEARSRIELSPLLREDRKYCLFLCRDQNLYGKFARKIGKPAQTQGFHLQPLGYTFISLSFIEEMRRRNNRGFQYNILEGNPAHVIAHEITHQLIALEIGYLKARKAETWKLEGYCEYTAALKPKRENPDYQFTKELEKYLNGFYGGITPTRKMYIESELMVEYLMDIRKWNVQALMKHEISTERLKEELKELVKER